MSEMLQRGHAYRSVELDFSETLKRDSRSSLLRTLVRDMRFGATTPRQTEWTCVDIPYSSCKYQVVSVTHPRLYHRLQSCQAALWVATSVGVYHSLSNVIRPARQHLARVADARALHLVAAEWR